MKIETIKLSEIHKNPDNPRTIKDSNFDKLVKSIIDFPEMLTIRPIVINKENMILGGNQRLAACKKAGLKEVPVIRAENLTEDQQKEFIIKDNLGFGEWDWELLENNWDSKKLEGWGVELDGFEDVDFNEIESNENRGLNDKSIEIKCPNCGEEITV